jgi:predicted permease
VRNVLVVTEVALSLVLLVGAGLLARSFVSLLNVDRGFETSNRMVASVNLPESYDPPRTREFFESLLGRLNSLPEVRSAAAVNFRPLQGASAGMGIATPENPGIPGETVPWATWRMVTPGYFSTLGLEMLRGRDFDGSDVIGDPWRVVVSRRLAEQLWPGADPLGRTAVLWRGQTERQAEVIGVVEDMRERGLAQDPTLAVYFPYFGAARWPPEIIVRSRVAPLELVPTIRSVLADIDPDLPLDDVATLGEVVRGSVSNRRLNTSLMGLLAGVALLLALAGVYGVQAYTVARRVPEIGVRMALGARPEQIAGLVMRQGMRPALVGVGLGTVLAFWLSRLVAGLLFGVSATDLPTFAVSAVVILATALLSCYVPARRALRVDPARVLRSE